MMMLPSSGTNTAQAETFIYAINCLRRQVYQLKDHHCGSGGVLLGYLSTHFTLCGYRCF
jgi:hypothetical protein